MSRKQLLGAAGRLSRGNRGGLISMIRNVEYGDRKKHQRTYLDGLKRYKNKGVRITNDGVECPEKEWEKIFEMGEDGGFYMGDYVGAEQGCLKEIRFDKVYLSDPPKEKKDKDS